MSHIKSILFAVAIATSFATACSTEDTGNIDDRLSHPAPGMAAHSGRRVACGRACEVLTGGCEAGDDVDERLHIACISECVGGGFDDDVVDCLAEGGCDADVGACYGE